MPRRSRSSARSAPSRASSRARTGGLRSASSSARSAAPAVRRSTASRPTAPQKSAPVPQKSAPASKPAAQPPQQGSAMGGFMANVASTGLGVMAGRAMDRAFFGGGGAAAPEDVPESAGDNYSNEAWGEQVPESVCAREALEFKKCMDRNASDVGSCQWNLDILAACQRQQQETGFADASRL